MNRRRVRCDSGEVGNAGIQSKSGRSDRLAVIVLYDAKQQRLAQIHFEAGITDVTVSEQADYVDVILSTDYLDTMYQLLRADAPLKICFFRNDNGVLDNVWFGTTHEAVGEEERKGLPWMLLQRPLPIAKSLTPA